MIIATAAAPSQLTRQSFSLDTMDLLVARSERWLPHSERRNSPGSVDYSHMVQSLLVGGNDTAVFHGRTWVDYRRTRDPPLAEKPVLRAYHDSNVLWLR
jgi:hypothetical protein